MDIRKTFDDPRMKFLEGLFVPILFSQYLTVFFGREYLRRGIVAESPQGLC